MVDWILLVHSRRVRRGSPCPLWPFALRVTANTAGSDSRKLGDKMFLSPKAVDNPFDTIF